MTTTGSTGTVQIVAGNAAADFPTVRHLTVSGSQREIGAALAESAREVYGWRPRPAEPLRARARLDWFARHWPQHHARMLGAAEALGVDPECDHVDGLTGFASGSACSVSFTPASLAADGHGRLGRNYDFFTTSGSALFAMIDGREPTAAELAEPPMAASPCVLTSVPGDGPATTVLTMDELDGCMEGVNEHGLAVALLIADAETARGPEPLGPQVGLASAQLPRFVLDTCATADEARRALLGAKQYDLGTPLHYLIADASGDAFVWERGAGGDEHIVSADGGSLCVTNHLLHRNPDVAALPEDDDETMRTYARYRALRADADAPDAGDRVRERMDAVAFDARDEGAYPVRTLWRSVIDVTERTLATSFYLGDEPDGSPRRSDELTFPVVTTP